MGVYGAPLGLWATRLLSNRVMDDVDTLRAGCTSWSCASGPTRLHTYFAKRDGVHRFTADTAFLSTIPRMPAV